MSLHDEDYFQWCILPSLLGNKRLVDSTGTFIQQFPSFTIHTTIPKLRPAFCFPWHLRQISLTEVWSQSFKSKARWNCWWQDYTFKGFVFSIISCRVSEWKSSCFLGSFVLLLSAHICNILLRLSTTVICNISTNIHCREKGFSGRLLFNKEHDLVSYLHDHEVVGVNLTQDIQSVGLSDIRTNIYTVVKYTNCLGDLYWNTPAVWVIHTEIHQLSGGFILKYTNCLGYLYWNTPTV